MNKPSHHLTWTIILCLCAFVLLRQTVEPSNFAAAKEADLQVEPTESISSNQTVTSTAFLPLLYNIWDVHVPSTDMINTSQFAVPDGRTLSCEHPWNIRLTTHSFSHRIHTQDMNFSSCNTSTDTPTMFAAMTLAHPNPDNPDDYIDNQSGMLVQTTLNNLTNELEVVKQREFPECKEMIGVQASNSCGLVAALCRTDAGRTDYDKDIVATHHNPDNWLQDVVDGRDEMWLYEWTNGDIQSTPSKYIVHKAIGSWEYGQFSLVYGENDNTYGVALKSTRNGHEADSFTVIDRDTYSIVQGRGWDWSCGSGHTLHNRPSYNPFTKEYGMLCGTDGNNLDAGRYGSISFTTETEEKENFLLLQAYKLRFKGGPGPLVPLGDGGWLGLVVGADGNLSYIQEGENSVTPSTPTTQIGLVKFDQNGDLMGDINWIVSADYNYASYPQLVPLENGNYLLGYGILPADSRSNSSYASLHWQLTYPKEYWLQEIDSNGEPAGQAWRMDGIGWGELDEMVSLGNNKIGWATYDMDKLTANEDDGKWDLPQCNAPGLQFNVYSSTQSSE